MQLSTSDWRCDGYRLDYLLFHQILYITNFNVVKAATDDDPSSFPFWWFDPRQNTMLYNAIVNQKNGIKKWMIESHFYAVFPTENAINVLCFKL